VLSKEEATLKEILQGVGLACLCLPFPVNAPSVAEVNSPEAAGGGQHPAAGAMDLACGEDQGPIDSMEQLTMTGRPKRVPGGNPLEKEPFKRFMGMIRCNSQKIKAEGRIHRLKKYMAQTPTPPTWKRAC